MPISPLLLEIDASKREEEEDPVRACCGVPGRDGPVGQGEPGGVARAPGKGTGAWEVGQPLCRPPTSRSAPPKSQECGKCIINVCSIVQGLQA